MSWKPEQYKASQIDKMIKSQEITVPKYQRGSKWTDSQRLSLIDSIKKGFPFGSILLDKKTASNGTVTYDLIDGLQRCTTIIKFLNNPGTYFKEDDISDSFVDQIYDLMDETDQGSDMNETKEMIKVAISQYVQKNLPTMEDVKSIQYYNVSSMLKKDWPSLSSHIDELNEIVFNIFKDFKQTCTDLTDAEIPAIIYDGDQRLLPEVFERINSKGTTLSKYDIYSASWGTDSFDITDLDFSDLYDYIVNRYQNMNDSEIHVADFDAIEYKNNKQITTFDLCYAFGKRLKHSYPNLFGKNKDISVDSIGFNLINSALGKPTTDLAMLNSNLKTLSNSIQQFLRDILDSCKIVDDYLKVITNLKGNSTKDLAILHSENQIISIIVSVFFAKYATVVKDKNDRIINVEIQNSENSAWTTKKAKFKQNVPIIYVQDSLTSTWSGTGDKKLYNIICDSAYYLRSIEQTDFDNIYNSWFDRTCLERNEESKIMSPNSTDKIILNIYTSQTVTAGDAHSADNWDIEHICPKKQMKDRIAEYNKAASSDDEHLKLPISSIGNVCYLPAPLNRSKEQKTIYESGLNTVDLKEVESKFTLTEKSDLDFLTNTSLTKDEFKKAYFGFIRKRSKKILTYLDKYFF